MKVTAHPVFNKYSIVELEGTPLEVLEIIKKLESLELEKVAKPDIVEEEYPSLIHELNKRNCKVCGKELPPSPKIGRPRTTYCAEPRKCKGQSYRFSREKKKESPEHVRQLDEMWKILTEEVR